MKKLISLVLISLAVFPSAGLAKNICGIYITGVGCPHCAASDPVILKDYTEEYPRFVVIEYEIYQTKENRKPFSSYIQAAGASQGVPQILIGDELKAGEKASGGGPTTTWTKDQLKNRDSAPCKLSDGSKKSFRNLILNELPGKPKIWRGNLILIREGEGKTDSKFLRSLLFKNISKGLNEIQYEDVQPKEVALSGQTVKFDNAVKLDGWRLQWENELITTNVSEGSTGNSTGNPGPSTAPSGLSINAVKSLNLSTLATGGLVSLAVLLLAYYLIKR